MSWFKIDDQLWGHPKWMAVPKGGRALWVTAGSWAAAHETDGRIPREALRALGGNAADASALVTAGLWREVKAGWIFHEWSIYQPDAASQKAKRKADAEAGVLGNHRRWHVKRGINVPDCEYCQGVPPDGDEPPIDDGEQYRVPDPLPDGPPDAFSIGSASPVPVPLSPSLNQVSGGGYQSDARASVAPPIQRCGEAHPSAQACSRCGDLRKADKQAEAERAKAEKAAQRQAELDRSRQAIHGDDEAHDPEATRAAAAKARQTLKEATA